MKKLLGIVSAIIAICMVLSVSVFAAEPLKEWKGDDILNSGGNAGKNETDKTREFIAGETLDGDHPVWGLELENIDTANGTKKFTVVVKIKNVEDNDSDDDETEIFSIDPKMRKYEGENKVDGPEDQPHPVTAGEIRDAKDEGGVKTFYYVVEPDVYGKEPKISIENRIRYNGESVGIGFDLVSITLYEGDVTPTNDNDGQDPTDEVPGDGDDVTPPTGDVSMALSLVLAAAAAYGGYKLRNK